MVFNQVPHQVDIVRLLAGAKAASVHAFTGNWDAARNTEGAYSAQIKFEDGSFASLTYSGYAHFDTDEFMGWWGELGQGRDGDTSYGRARLNLQKATTPADEIAMKNARAYGPAGRDAFHVTGEVVHNHFGLVVASCERADLRPLPHGVMVYGDKTRHLDEIPPPKIPRAEVVDELYAAGQTPRRSFRRMGPGDAGDLPCDPGVGEDGTRGGVEVAGVNDKYFVISGRVTREPGILATARKTWRQIPGSARSLSSGARSRDQLGLPGNDDVVRSLNYSPATR